MVVVYIMPHAKKHVSSGTFICMVQIVDPVMSGSQESTKHKNGLMRLKNDEFFESTCSA